MNVAQGCVAHARSADGLTHLALILTDGLEDFVVGSNKTNPMPIVTECIDDGGHYDQYLTLDVYWVDVDVVPTCMRCVGVDARHR